MSGNTIFHGEIEVISEYILLMKIKKISYININAKMFCFQDMTSENFTIFCNNSGYTKILQIIEKNLKEFVLCQVQFLCAF